MANDRGVTWLDHRLAELLRDMMVDLGNQVGELQKYADEKVFDKSGFDVGFDLFGKHIPCALAPLGDVMDTLSGAMDDATVAFTNHWDGMIHGVEVATGLLVEADTPIQRKDRP